MKKIIFLLLFNLFVSAAFAADGDLDASFGAGGIVNETFHGFIAGHYSSLVQPDGKIVAAGQSLNASFINDYTLARYLPNGTLDASFGTGGKLYADVGGRNDIIPTIVLQPDGKIVLVGNSRNEQDRNTIAIFRFNADGSPDTNFGTNGRTLSAFTTSGTRGDTPSDAVLQPDGKIVVSGSWQGTAFCVARWNSDGSLDTGFGTGGQRCNEGSPVGTGQTTSIAMQPDGKIVMSGGFTTSFTVPFDFIVYRFNANGSLDTTFDGDGYAITDLNGGNDTAFSVIVKPDGKILAVGSARAINAPDTGFGLVQYNANGSLDASFGTGGKALTTFTGGEGFNEEFPAVLQSNGKIVAGRTRRRESPNIGNESQIARFNANGALDTTFGSGGQIVFVPIQNLKDLALQPDGKIVAVGSNQSNTAIAARFFNTDSAPPIANSMLRVADFDGDGRTDASVFRNGTWFIDSSNDPRRSAPDAFYAVRFGLATDRLAPADYDGDGRTDIAVWRENVAGSESYFYILQSSNNAVRIEQFGLTGDVLTIGDWDGDGKADISTYREGAQSYFYFRGSLNNPSGGLTFVPWGTAGDVPVRGDFDGDGRTDAAVFRPSDQTWYIRQSSDSRMISRQFGLATDKRVSGDFDGDGKTDIAVFRDGLWCILQSSNNQIRYQNWGLNTDVLAAGDYDGDGKTDTAVWRGGIYYILNSSNSAFTYRNFGADGDAVIASAYVR